jgi:ATP-binding cassette subfamily B (MDR/TAP) protein 1
MTLVGEGGIKLSGGQRQRLAIARSIIKRPQILIFDEATSAIDVRSERIVQAALDRVAQNRTTITIAHRLSTIKKADKIVVVSKGRVVEQGTHDELLSVDGVYHDLVYAQQLTMNTAEGTTETDDTELNLSHTLSRHDTEKKTESFMAVAEDVYKPKGFFGSFGFLLMEQKSHLIWLVVTLIGAAGAGSKYSHHPIISMGHFQY